MRDVARAAGVSVTTVSYVLSERPGVTISQSTSRRVREEARRLNYRHNALAADLRRGESSLVAIQLYSLGVPILARKVTALEAGLRSAGLYPFLSHATDPDAERRFYRECASRRVRGLVLTAPPSPQARPSVRQLIAHGIPVLSTEPAPELGLPYVTVDRGGGAETAVRHLASLGHRRIAAVIGFTDQAEADFREGYQRGLSAAGLEPEPDLLLPVLAKGAWYAVGAEAARTLLRIPRRPTAILTTDDEVAIGVVRALQEEGLRVPEDVAVIGCDDSPPAAYCDVPLTTLAQPADAVGAALAELFIEAMAHPEAVSGRAVTLPMELIIRASCGARR